MNLNLQKFWESNVIHRNSAQRCIHYWPRERLTLEAFFCSYFLCAGIWSLRFKVSAMQPVFQTKKGYVAGMHSSFPSMWNQVGSLYSGRYLWRDYRHASRFPYVSHIGVELISWNRRAVCTGDVCPRLPSSDGRSWGGMRLVSFTLHATSGLRYDDPIFGIMCSTQSGNFEKDAAFAFVWICS